MEFPLNVRAQLDWDLYLKYNWLVFWKSKFVRIFLMTLEVVGFLALIIGIVELDGWMLAGSVFCMVFYPLLLLGIVYLKARNVYRKNPIMHKEEVQVSFDEEGFTLTTPTSHARYAYTELAAIHEHKVFYPLMLGKNFGQVIRKQDCSSDLIGWIEELKATYPKK